MFNFERLGAIGNRQIITNARAIGSFKRLYRTGANFRENFNVAGSKNKIKMLHRFKKKWENNFEVDEPLDIPELFVPGFELYF